MGPGCVNLIAIAGNTVGLLISVIAGILSLLVGTRQIGSRDRRLELRGYDLDEHDEWDEREELSRASRGRRIPIQGPDDDPEPQREEPQQPERSPDIGSVVLALAAGLGMGIAVSFALAGGVVDWSINLMVPPLIGLGVGALIYAALYHFTTRSEQGPVPSTRTVRRQVSRIQSKARSISREARRVAGVYSDLDWQAPELAREARELGELLCDLRAASREIRRDSGNPVLPPGVPEDERDEGLRAQFEAARSAHQRLQQMIARNRRSQQLCLTQLKRIEDLLDAARLQISQPMQPPAEDEGRAELVREFETELTAARQALEEVQQIRE
ncbi:MAG: hypothetical protein U9R79_02010 [Armatimonadota bacterium]|nr:hypothetical protein [Armatimonadota bacterium]